MRLQGIRVPTPPAGAALVDDALPGRAQNGVAVSLPSKGPKA